MKPTKNHIFCPDCNRAKMSFPSKEKALAFIRYNGQDVVKSGGKKQTRTYYCAACAAWHLTSSHKKAYTSKFQKSLYQNTNQGNNQVKASNDGIDKKTVTEKNWTRDDYMRCFKSGLRRIKLTYFPSREEAFNAFTEAFNRYKKASEKGLFEPNYMSNVLRRFKTIARDYGFYNEIEKWEKNISQENSNFDG